MSEPNPGGPGLQPLTLAERVDCACDDFEAAWRGGCRPRIEEYVTAAPGTERPALLGELLATELELRRAAGESPSPEEYRARFPADATVVDAAFSNEPAPAAQTSPVARPGSGTETTIARDSPDDPASAPRIGPGFPTIPGYEFLGELGRGGMGVVYRARQVVLNRICAIKMILAGELAGERAIVRFLAEAESAAKLRHPNVVRVYRLGEWAGRPFLELEYVEGGSLADRLDGTPWPAREAARMVEVLARAIDEAHRLGIVHRDLKPANVLLQANGTPMITDFGLAKAIGVDSGLTRTEEVLGTPSYMAPEQAGGRARHAGPLADVYALGAILYQLVAGRPPFKAATVLETLEQVRTVEPIAPRRFQPKLPRDLETACLKCLRKEPAGRYGTAAELADDLGRFLDGLPIRARPLGGPQRLWRWCRRNPAVAALSASVAMLLLAAAVGAGLAALQFRRLALRAEQNLERAGEVVDEMYTQVAQQLDDKKGMDASQRDILQKALRFYEGFAIQQGPGPAIRYEAARANTRVGTIQFKLGRLKEAEAAFLRSRDLLEPLVAEHRDVAGYRVALAAALRSLGRLELITGRDGEAERVLEQSVAIARTLAEAHPGVADYRRDVASGLNELSAVFRSNGRTGRAEGALREALSTLTRLAEPQGGAGTQADRLSMARAREDLGEILLYTSRFAEAEAEFLLALGLLEPLTASHPEITRYRSTLATIRNDLGSLHRQAGRPEKAEELTRAALTAREKLVDEHPGNADYDDDLADSLLCLGNIHSDAGRTSEAEAAYRKSLAIRERMAGANPDVVEYRMFVAAARNNLAYVYIGAKRLDDAAAEFGRAEAAYEQVVRLHPDEIEGLVGLGITLDNLGTLIGGRGQFEEARRRWSRGAEVLEQACRRVPDHGEARKTLGIIYSNLAEVATAERRYADAVSDWDRGLPLLVGREKAQFARVRRAVNLARLQDHARAAADAAASVDGPTPGGLLYDAACAHAIASSAALRDERLPAPDRRRSSERYAATAVTLLVRAGEAGYLRESGVADLLRQDPDLDSLRPNPDFQLLLMDAAFPTDPLARPDLAPSPVVAPAVQRTSSSFRRSPGIPEAVSSATSAARRGSATDLEAGSADGSWQVNGGAGRS